MSINIYLISIWFYYIDELILSDVITVESWLTILLLSVLLDLSLNDATTVNLKTIWLQNVLQESKKIPLLPQTVNLLTSRMAITQRILLLLLLNNLLLHEFLIVLTNLPHLLYVEHCYNNHVLLIFLLKNNLTTEIIPFYQPIH